MHIRHKIFCAAVLLGLSASVPALARVDFDIGVDVAPPPPQVEVVPVPRPGYEWMPGYWAWEGNQYMWVQGRWIGERPGYRWTPEHWEHHGNKWRFERGYWDRRR